MKQPKKLTRKQKIEQAKLEAVIKAELTKLGKPDAKRPQAK